MDRKPFEIVRTVVPTHRVIRVVGVWEGSSVVPRVVIEERAEDLLGQESWRAVAPCDFGKDRGDSYVWALGDALVALHRECEALRARVPAQAFPDNEAAAT